MKIFIAIFTIIYLFDVAWAGDLKFVTVVYRHGDRSPNYVYPTDPHPPSTWPNGIGELTNLGKNQTYELGKYIREHYKNFLPFKYHKDDIFVLSSDKNRAIMSASCVLAGLYEPQGDDVWSKSLLWQPIPVRSLPQATDNLINYRVNCPKHKQLLKNRVFKRNKKLLNKYKRIMIEMSRNAGLPALNHTSQALSLGLGIYSCLSAEEKHGLELPEWTKTFYPEPLREITKFAYAMRSYDVPLKRLRCGPLLKDIIQHLDDVTQGTLKVKMWQYSGHDQTVVDLLQCLNVHDGDLVPYASAVFIELYDNEGDFEVAIRYKKNEELKELEVPGCKPYCPLHLFKELMRDVTPDNWNEECKNRGGMANQRSKMLGPPPLPHPPPPFAGKNTK